MVNPSSMGTLATMRPDWHIVNESFKVLVDRVAYSDFLRVGVDNLASFIGGEEVLETGRTVSIIGTASDATVYPSNAVRASLTTAMGYALVTGRIYSSLCTVGAYAPSSATMDSALAAGRICSRLCTVGVYAPFSATMGYALVAGRICSSRCTVGVYATWSATMSSALVTGNI